MIINYIVLAYLVYVIYVWPFTKDFEGKIDQKELEKAMKNAETKEIPS